MFVLPTSEAAAVVNPSFGVIDELPFNGDCAQYLLHVEGDTAGHHVGMLHVNGGVHITDPIVGGLTSANVGVPDLYLFVLVAGQYSPGYVSSIPAENIVAQAPIPVPVNGSCEPLGVPNEETWRWSEGIWVTNTGEVDRGSLDCGAGVSAQARGAASLDATAGEEPLLRITSAMTENMQVQINTHTKDHHGPWLTDGLHTFQARSVGERAGTIQTAEVQLAINESTNSDEFAELSRRFAARIRHGSSYSANANPAGRVEIFADLGANVDADWVVIGQLANPPAGSLGSVPVTIRVNADFGTGQYHDVAVLYGDRPAQTLDASAHSAGIVDVSGQGWHPGMTFSLEASNLADLQACTAIDPVELTYDLASSGILAADGQACGAGVLDALPCVPTCDGRVVTMNMNTNGGSGFGTGGDDVILGTAGNDTINGRAGNDVICAGVGDDTVVGSAGDDRIFGEGGDDTLFGSGGRDYISGGGGEDHILGQGDVDSLYGNDGNDIIKGGGSNDFIWGGSGIDRLFGNGGRDKIWGGPGLDFLWGNNHDDMLYGGASRDIITGGFGVDFFDGAGGRDYCTDVKSSETAISCEQRESE